MIDLGDLGGGESHAHDINNVGQVTGESRDATGNYRAFLWDPNNGIQDLGTLGGATSTAYAINDAGEVVGYSLVGSTYHAFLYSGGVMNDLDTFAYFQSAAFDVNNSQEIVGTLVSYGDYKSTGFIYADGSLTDLGSPILEESQCWVINNTGLISGYSWGAGEERSFLYAGELVVDLGEIAGYPKTYAYGINDAGQVVGSVTNTAGTVSHAFIYTGGQLLDLNNLLVAGHGWEELSAAYAVNSSGQIVGYGRINGEFRAFLLTPEP
jgi:probable HAF family extracellular repeat protein